MFFASSQISLRSAARHCDCCQHFLSGSAAHATLLTFVSTFLHFCLFPINISLYQHLQTPLRCSPSICSRHPASSTISIQARYGCRSALQASLGTLISLGECSIESLKFSICRGSFQGFHFLSHLHFLSNETGPIPGVAQRNL